jgi:hypothetical protein
MANESLSQEPLFTYTSNSCGYTLFKDGAAVGGAMTLSTATHTSDGRVRHWRHRRADIKMFREAGQVAVQRLIDAEAKPQIEDEEELTHGSPDAPRG